jgi:hypothetical protein
MLLGYESKSPRIHTSNYESHFAWNSSHILRFTVNVKPGCPVVVWEVVVNTDCEMWSHRDGFPGA